MVGPVTNSTSLWSLQLLFVLRVDSSAECLVTRQGVYFAEAQNIVRLIRKILFRADPSFYCR